MKSRYLEITYRRGKTMSAYLYLQGRSGAKVARTTVEDQGLKVDFDAAGKVMGIEITAPSLVTMADLNALLGRLGQLPLEPEEWAPAQAA